MSEFVSFRTLITLPKSDRLVNVEMTGLDGQDCYLLDHCHTSDTNRSGVPHNDIAVDLEEGGLCPSVIARSTEDPKFSASEWHGEWIYATRFCDINLPCTF